MIGSSMGRRVFAYGGPVDMRKGYDGLYSLVVEELGRDPLSGDLYLFVSRNRIRAKVLLWDGTGLCVYGMTSPWPVLTISSSSNGGQGPPFSLQGSGGSGGSGGSYSCGSRTEPGFSSARYMAART